MKKLVVSAALVFGLAGSAAQAADLPMATKEPLPPSGPVACTSLYDFVLTACPLTWAGVTLYGTVDMGGTYQTHGTPFDPNFPTGASYLQGAGGTGATNRKPGFGWGPNAMSQSLIGVKSIEPLGGGWSFVSVNELAFDPYSLLLANAPQALQNAKFTSQNNEALPVDSSRWGWLAGQNALGFSSPVYGTLLFGRQNDLYNDAIVAYDPMGAAYAFSPIGFSGKAAGAGDTEDARWTTAIKYRVNIGDFRLSAMGQPLSGTSSYDAYNPNAGAVSGGIGGDIKNLGPGVLSVDVIGDYERSALNVSPAYFGQTTVNGFPAGANPFPATAYLKATLSDQTSVMAVAKYSFGSWGNNAPPIVGKAAPAPSGPSGIPLTLYAGYEWIQFASPSDRPTSLRDDGFLFVDPTVLTGGHGALAAFPGPGNATSINVNGFDTLCGTGTAGVGCHDEVLQIWWAGAKYGITRDLDIVGAYYQYEQSEYTSGAATCVIASAHSQCAGRLYVYSAVLDWRFLPKWDAYIGTMYSAAYGGIANGGISPTGSTTVNNLNNWASTAGVRFRF